MNPTIKALSPALLVAVTLFSGCASAHPRALSSEPNALFGPVLRQEPGTVAYCPEERVGGICEMTQPNALLACQTQGNHLPTAREFGAYSQANGAKGILEVKNAEEKAPAGFYRVDSINPGNQRDDLHFSHEGYDPKRGNLGKQLYWTSSLVPANQNFAHVFYGEWGGGGGDPKDHEIKKRHAVRCVVDRI